MNIVESIRHDIEGVFTRHAGEIEAGLADAAAVVSGPLAQAEAAALHIPPVMLTILADAVSQLDAEFGKIVFKAQREGLVQTSRPTAPDPTAPVPAAAWMPADATPSSAASGPSEPAPLVVGPPGA